MGSITRLLTPVLLAGAVASSTGCGKEAAKDSGTHLITVSNVVTSWSEDGSTRDESSPGPISDAVFSQGLGTASQRDYPGTRNADGSWSAELPRGPYWAKVTGSAPWPRWYEVASGGALLDLGVDQWNQGVPLAATTPVTFDVSGLRPWIAGDELRVYGWNAAAMMASAVALAPGVQAGSITLDWKANWASLVRPADQLWVTQARQAAASDGGVSRSVVAARSVTGVSMTDGAPLTVPVAGMAEPAALGSLALDWRLSQFQAAAQPGVRPGGATVSVWSQPVPAYVAGPTHFLLELTPVATGDHDYGSLSYGRPLPSTWYEVVDVSWTGSVTRTIPGTALTATLKVRVSRLDAAGTAPTPMVPYVGAVTGLRVGGRDAMVPQGGVGLTPTLGWDPPPVGVPTEYIVGLNELRGSGSTASTVLVARINTTGTSFTLPAGLLQAGKTYVIQVTTMRNKIVPGSARAWRVAGPWGSATSWSETIQP